MGQLVGTSGWRRALALALIGLLLTGSVAGADTQDDVDADGWVTDQGGGVVVEQPGGGGGSPTPNLPGRPRSCQYFLQDSSAGTIPGAIGLGDEVSIATVRASATVATLVWRVCTWLDTGERGMPQLIVVPPNPGLVARAAAERAAAELVLPLPSPRTSPPGPTVVNLDTWLWTEPVPPSTRAASVAGVTATVVGRPVRTVWQPGDGTEVTCDGLGNPYDPGRRPEHQRSACTHVYARRRGLLAASVTVVWHLGWTATNGESGDLGEVARTSSFDIEVLELDVVLRRR